MINTVDSALSTIDRFYDPCNQEIQARNQFETQSSQFSGTSSIAGKVVKSKKEKKKGKCASCLGFFTANKFGTWDGVFLSCLLTMFGVIMFIRLGYIVGQAGIWQTWIIELISVLVVFITTLSMSVLGSNGEIKTGGAYYLISRSLGPAIGGGVGILFSLGNSIAVALHILGFVEPLISQINHIITNSVINDMRLLGSCLLLILLIFAVVGVGWMIKVQILIALLLLATIICFIVGCFITTNQNLLITSVSLTTFNANFNSHYTEGQNFLTLFAIFFPAMTGIMAGANLSGDLKTPSKSIPLGTITAVLTAGFVYLTLSTFVGAVALRGHEENCAMTVENVKGICFNLIMEQIALPGIMIYVGVYAATISSALAALVGAPRILMTVANDNILKFLNIFSKKRKNGEPTFAYIPVFFIALGCILIGDLNVIANIVTIAYLMTYSLVNFACFQSSLTKSPGWRPKFKIYSKWVSLFGAITCFTLMFILNYIIALPIFFFSVLVYLIIYFLNPDVNWGSSNEDVAQITIVSQLYAQRKRKVHIKNYRPNFLLLTKNIVDDMKKIFFIHSIKNFYGVNILGIVRESMARKPEDFFEADSYEKNSKITMFQKEFVHQDYYEACYILLRTVGIGRLKPNTVFISHDKKWRDSPEIAQSYFNFLCGVCHFSTALMVAANFESLNFCNSDPFGTVDIWWLYDDGGLSVLIPHILSKSVFWKRNTGGSLNAVPLRLFVVSEDAENVRTNLGNLLNRFRLEGIDLQCVFPGKDEIEENLDKMAKKDKNEELKGSWEMLANLVKKHSKKAKLVFCTLPLPIKKKGYSSFLNIIDTIAEDMPPIIMMRGNGKSVLTWSHE